jgi:hypothetical protein
MAGRIPKKGAEKGRQGDQGRRGEDVRSVVADATVTPPR